MRRALITVLIISLSLHSMGDLLNTYGVTRLLFSPSSGSEILSTHPGGPEKQGQKNGKHGENQEFLELPAQDDYCLRPFITLALNVHERTNGHFTDCFISHYPWAPKEIHTPPPKA